jgi:hypothetical protein
MASVRVKISAHWFLKQIIFLYFLYYQLAKDRAGIAKTLTEKKR